MDRTFYTSWAELALLIAPTLWLGLLAGVSFIATSVKFNAASLTLPVALDVGRATFSVFNKIEWIAFGVSAVAVIFSGPSALPSILAVLLGAILLLQTIWLLPVLDSRIAAIIAGQVQPLSIDHFVYIGLDVAKAGLLLFLMRTQLMTLHSAIS